MHFKKKFSLVLLFLWWVIKIQKFFNPKEWKVLWIKWILGVWLSTTNLLGWSRWRALNIWSWNKNYLNFKSFENCPLRIFFRFLTVNSSKVTKLKRRVQILKHFRMEIRKSILLRLTRIYQDLRTQFQNASLQNWFVVSLF